MVNGDHCTPMTALTRHNYKDVTEKLESGGGVLGSGGATGIMTDCAPLSVRKAWNGSTGSEVRHLVRLGPGFVSSQAGFSTATRVGEVPRDFADAVANCRDVVDMVQAAW